MRHYLIPSKSYQERELLATSLYKRSSESLIKIEIRKLIRLKTGESKKLCTERKEFHKV